MKVFSLHFLFLLIIVACTPLTKQGHNDEAAVATDDSGMHTKYLNFKLIGTEPFWSCDIRGDSMHFSNSEGLYVSQKILTRDASRTFISQKILVKLVAENCSDGMSETKYEYKARLTLDSLIYEGCAFIIE